MKIDLQFPTEITITYLRLDTDVWSTTARLVNIIELTVPQEEGIEATFERKKATVSMPTWPLGGWLEV